MSCFEKVSAVIVGGFAIYIFYQWWTKKDPDPQDYERADKVEPTPKSTLDPTPTRRVRRRRNITNDDLLSELERTKHTLDQVDLARHMRENAQKLE